MSFSLYISVLAATDTIALLKGKIDILISSFPFYVTSYWPKRIFGSQKIDLMSAAFSLKVKLIQYMKKYVAHSDKFP